MDNTQAELPVIYGVICQGLRKKYIDCNDNQLDELLKNYSEGDKVKIIIIKEDEP